MTFYQQLSRYYDAIFKTSQETVDFITEIAGESPSNILDIACGTGGYALELSKRGYHLHATDLDDGMIHNLRTKAREHGVALQAEQGNMNEISQLPKGHFQTIFCIGNSLVHLGCVDEIQKFFNDAYDLLPDGGSLIIQTVNFDKIFKTKQTGLPEIKNAQDDVTFKREYEFISESKVNFKTTLTVEGESFENSVSLTPLFSTVAKEMAEAAGFKSISVNGSFGGGTYMPSESNALILVAIK